jgi:hypothetical protein
MSCAASNPQRLCTYSKAMHQPYPRKCTVCGEPEPQRIVGHIAHGHAHTAPDAGTTLDEMFGDGVITKDGNIEVTESVETLTGNTATAWREYDAALKGLRDTELAFKRAQDRYRKALEGLNAARLV